MEPGTRNTGGTQKGFKQLRAWVAADDLASLTFRSVQPLPGQHRWLGIQMARAALSVPANIAEGYGRGSLGDYLRFLDIARGSLSELEYYLHFCRREFLLDSVTLDGLEEARERTGSLLFGLWQSLKRKAPSTWDRSGLTIAEDREIYSASPDFLEDEENLVPGSLFHVPEGVK